MLSLAPAVAAPALAAPTAVNLQDYRLDGVYLLPLATAEEASAITYNWDSDTLFVLAGCSKQPAGAARDGRVDGAIA